MVFNTLAAHSRIQLLLLWEFTKPLYGCLVSTYNVIVYTSLYTPRGIKYSASLCIHCWVLCTQFTVRLFYKRKLWYTTCTKGTINIWSAVAMYLIIACISLRMFSLVSKAPSRKSDGWSWNIPDYYQPDWQRLHYVHA